MSATPSTVRPPMLSEWILRQLDRPPQRPHLRLSQSGADCVRRVVYEATGAPSAPRPISNRLAMELGTAFDKHMLAEAPSYLPREAVLPAPLSGGRAWAFQVDVVVRLGNLAIPGHADAVYYGGLQTPIHVADLKVVGENTWSKVQNGPKKEHAAQVNLYAYGLGAASWSVLYIRKDPPKPDDDGEIVPADFMVEHLGYRDDYTARKDFGMFEEAALFMQANAVPPRPYEDFEDIDEDGNTVVKIARDGFPCAWCPYETHCWGARPEETKE